jgi:hypothetical protein
MAEDLRILDHAFADESTHESDIATLATKDAPLVVAEEVAALGEGDAEAGQETDAATDASVQEECVSVKGAEGTLSPTSIVPWLARCGCFWGHWC